MNEEKSVWFNREANILLIIGVLCIVVGLTLVLIFKPDNLIWKLIFGFITEIGFAALIAWGVSVIIEKKSREQYDKYTQEKSRLISKNVFGYLYGVHLPRTVFQAIETHLFKPKVVKVSQRLLYELPSPKGDHTDWIKMRCEYDYVLKNLSDDFITDHPVRFYVSDPTDTEAPTMNGLGLQSLTIGDEVIDPKRFTDLDLAADDEIGVKKYEKRIHMAPKSEVRVQVTFFQAKRLMDNDLYQTMCLTERLEMRLRYDPRNFDVYIEPVHPFSFDKNEDATVENGCKSVAINTPLLPGNGVFMWWKYKDIAA